MKYNDKLVGISTIPIDIFKTILYIISCIIITLLFIKFYRLYFHIDKSTIKKLSFYKLLFYILLDLGIFSIYFIVVNKLVKYIWQLIGFNISLENIHKEYFGAVSLILVFVIFHFFDSFQFKMITLHQILNKKN